MQFEATQRRSAWVRRALCLAAAGLLSACIGNDAVRGLDSAPARLQDDNAVVAPCTAHVENGCAPA